MEFSCRKEILILPKQYGTLDSEYALSDLSSRLAECKNFSEVQYIHFTIQGKPWSYAHSQEGFLSAFDPEAASVIRRWFVHAHQSCPWIVPRSSSVDDTTS